MAAITIRMSPELRARMKRNPHVNWSSVVRNAVEARLRLEEMLAKPIDQRRARAAARRMDEMSGRLRGGKSLAEEVRKWRYREARTP